MVGERVQLRQRDVLHRQINPKLLIDGILLTMVDSRTNFAREISALLRETSVVNKSAADASSTFRALLFKP